MFDIQAAIIDLDARKFGFDPEQDVTVLRDRHPDLASTWDNLECLQELASDSVPESDYKELEAEADRLAQIAADARDHLTYLCNGQFAMSYELRNQIKEVIRWLD